MTAFSNLNGWQRLWLLCAVIWAIPVALYMIQEISTETESEIKSQWANAKIELIKKHHSSGETLAALRQRLYGSASDEEIIHPAQTHSGHFDFSTAVPVDESQAVDSMYESRLGQRQNQSTAKILMLGFLAWLAPVAGLYLFGKAVRWVYDGFRSN